jgi:hypothetical protein
LLAEENIEGPTNEKAQKTYKEAFEYLHKRIPESALESFKKADKQDGGHCLWIGSPDSGRAMIRRHAEERMSAPPRRMSDSFTDCTELKACRTAVNPKG